MTKLANALGLGLCSFSTSFLIVMVPYWFGWFEIPRLLFPLWFCLYVNGIYTGTIANKKCYDKMEWSARGCFHGPFALIAACGLPDKLMYKRLKEIEELELL